MKTLSRRGAVVFALAVAFAALLGLSACASNDGSGNLPNEDRSAAKTIIKAASNVFAASENLDVRPEESPVTVSDDDPRFAKFFEELSQYKGVSEIDVQDCTFTVAVQSVTAATAREDSAQTNYHYESGADDWRKENNV